MSCDLSTSCPSNPFNFPKGNYSWLVENQAIESFESAYYSALPSSKWSYSEVMNLGSSVNNVFGFTGVFLVQDALEKVKNISNISVDTYQKKLTYTQNFPTSCKNIKGPYISSSFYRSDGWTLRLECEKVDEFRPRSLLERITSFFWPKGTTTCQYSFKAVGNGHVLNDWPLPTCPNTPLYPPRLF